ncbi:unnamed protein product [Orchesella dallaii]|uniref:Uncharacterized protein n=1 Tax=Orchesella dallaii TaxID=48710 RepID=A0ABP1R7E0_9HEXA
MEIPSLFPPWRTLWLNPHSPTTQQYPFGQLLVSLAEEVENEALKYGRDWRLQETGRENLLDVSTDVRQILLSAADIFETAGRVLMNPGTPSDLSKKSENNTASASRLQLRPPFRRSVEKMKEDYGVSNSAENDTDSIAVTPTPPLVLVLTKTSRGRGSGRPNRAKKPRTQSYS